MSDYCTQSQAESYWGTTNIGDWSNKDGRTKTADATAVATAISVASEYIDTRFRGSRYAVPLAATSGGVNGVPYLVNRWAIILTGWFLYEARGLNDEGESSKLLESRQAVDAEMAGVLMGSRRLNAARGTNSSGPSAPVVV